MSSVTTGEPATVAITDVSAAVRRTFILKNRQGLHARPAALLVLTLRPFECDVQVQNRDEVANAVSLLGLLTLAANYGSELTFTAKGTNATEALNAVAKLFENNFAAAY